MLTTDQQNHLYRMYLKRSPDAGAKKGVGKITWEEQVASIKKSTEYKSLQSQAKSSGYAIGNHAPTGIRAAYKGCDKSVENAKIKNLEKANKDLVRLTEEIRETAKLAESGLKKDLEASQARIFELTGELAGVQQDLDEANKASEEAVENFFVKLAKAIADRLKGFTK